MTGIIENGTIQPALLVLGAAGPVGRGAVAAALQAGRRVVAVDEDVAALERSAPAPGLTVLRASLARDGDARRLIARLRGLDTPLGGVVASLAGRHPCGRLIDQAADVLRRALDEDLMPHLFAARHLFPLLPAGSGYVLVGGPGGQYPWAGYGHCSIAAAALRMMARVLRDEAGRNGLRVQLLSLDAPVGEDDASGRALALGRRALALLEDQAAHAPAGAAVPPRSAPSPSRLPAARGRPPDLPPRELRDARRLLARMTSLPLSGPLEDERF